MDFCRFLEPTEEEEKSRLAAVERVREAVMTIWPSRVRGGARFARHEDVFAVVGRGRSHLRFWCKIIGIVFESAGALSCQEREARNIQLISKARVPIVKFEETKSGIQFDVVI